MNQLVNNPLIMKTKETLLFLLLSFCLVQITLSQNTQKEDLKSANSDKENAFVNFLVRKLDAITGAFLTKNVSTRISEITHGPTTTKSKSTTTNEKANETTEESSNTTTYLVITLFTLQYIASIVIK